MFHTLQNQVSHTFDKECGKVSFWHWVVSRTFSALFLILWLSLLLKVLCRRENFEITILVCSLEMQFPAFLRLLHILLVCNSWKKLKILFLVFYCRANLRLGYIVTFFFYLVAYKKQFFNLTLKCSVIFLTLAILWIYR